MNPSKRSKGRVELDTFEELVGTIHAKGGPVEADYPDLLAALHDVAGLLWADPARRDDVDRVLEACGPAFEPDTMQGFAWRKPLGYAGDFVTIDKFHTNARHPDPVLGRWDAFSQAQPGAAAVRNRARYLWRLVEGLEEEYGRPIRVLNVACGPCRDVLGYYEGHPDSDTRFDCIDLDSRALDHAREICGAQDGRVTYECADARRYDGAARYDLIWSAGLFDYFPAEVFSNVLRHLGGLLAPGGRIVLGNFCSTDPNRAYMDVLDWHLHRRSASVLRRLAEAAGFPSDAVRVEREPLGVNLFLHVRT